MKKLSALLNTSARTVIAIGIIMLVSELLIMAMIKSISHTLLKVEFLEKMAFEFIDPILLVILVSPALFLLIFRPMHAQQAVLERQLEDLRRFHNLSIGRELRMKELVEEIAVLRHPFSVEPAGEIPITSGSLEAPRDVADQFATTLPTEQSQLSVLLFMLEDLENAHKKIKQAHHEWVAALDVVGDPIFLHDKHFRILRCNKAYQRLAGIPFKQIIGQPYYEVFPKNHTPMPCCLQAMEKAEAASEEVVVGDAIYRSRAFSVHDEQGTYLYSVHTLEDITEKQRAEAERQRLSEAIRQAAEAIAMANADACISYINPAFTRLFGYAPDEIIGKSTAILAAPAAETLQPDEAFRLVREQGLFQGETLRRAKDGTILPVYINVAALHSTEGRFEGFVTAITDLRPVKQAQQALVESEAKYRMLIESLQEGIWMIDKGANTSFVNLRMAQMLGYSVEEMQGRHLFSFMDERGKEIATQNLERRKQGTTREQHDFELLRKDGSRIYTSMATSPILDQDGNYAGALAGVTDITERRQIEEELRLRAQLLDCASDTIFMVDFDGNFVYLNEAAWKTRGYTRDEMMGMNLHVLDTPKYEKLIESRMRDLMENGQSIFESEHRRKDGSAMPIEVSARIIESGGRKLVLSVIRDITERKQAEEAVRESEEKYRGIYENTQVGLYRTRASDGKLMMANDAMAKMFGFDSVEEATAKYVTSEHYVDRGTREMLLGALQKYGRFDNFEACLTRNDGMVRWFQYSGRIVRDKGYIEGVATDITERKQAEQKLKDLSARLQHILASTPAVHYVCRVDGERFVPTYASPNLKDLWGYGPEEYLGNAEWWWSCIHPEGRDSIAGAFRTAVMAAGHSHYAHEYRFRHKDGTCRWVHDELQIIRDQAGQSLEIVGSWLDITERKQAETAIQHANRALATLSAVNRNLVHASDENELLQAICDAIVEQKGYRLAWVGYVQHDENKSIKIMAHAGHDEGYLDAMQLTWAESERGMGSSGRAVRSGTMQLCQDIANDPYYSPWRDAASQRGYASDIALTLIGESGDTFGILHVYAAEVNAFTPVEIDLLEEMAGDLAFGVRSLYIRRQRDLAMELSQRHLEKLRNSLEDTVRAMASLVEMRDPYTAGHQARVADLAAAIARQMGLSEEQEYGIHLAGTVHDLGKIKVPAEILSKPGRINDLEFGLIKVHPQAGYDILKGIDFPWPIAQMVLQHHERLDGSGYPQGLKGDDILLEARILSVADTVEAMSSHRPYRPGLGIEVALAEITKQRGVRYDPRVVDACLALFREQHYSFKS